MSDSETHYPQITPRQMLLCRWVAGIFGLLFLVGVTVQIMSGEFRYAISNPDYPRGTRIVGHETRTSVAGLVFAFLSFGMMGVSTLMFALKPSLYKNPAVIWIVVGIILISFAGLSFTR